MPELEGSSKALCACCSSFVWVDAEPSAALCVRYWASR